MSALLDIDQVASLLGVSKSFVRTAASSGALKSCRLSPQLLRFRSEDVEAYVAANVR